MSTRTLTMVVIAAILTSCALAQEGDLLRLKFAADEQLRYEVKLDGTGSIQVMGQNQRLDVKGTLTQVLKIEEIDAEGNYVLVSKVEDPDLDVLLDGQALTGLDKFPKSRITLSPRGQVLEMKVLNEDELTGGNQEMARLMAGSLDMESLVRNLNTVPFPEQAVKEGDEWEGAMPGEGADPANTITVQIKHAGYQDCAGVKCVRLESSQKVALGGAQQEGALMEVKGDSFTQMATWFDPQAGRVLADSGSVTLQVNMTLPIQGTQLAIYVELVCQTQSKLKPAEAGNAAGG